MNIPRPGGTFLYKMEAVCITVKERFVYAATEPVMAGGVKGVSFSWGDV